MLHTDNAAVCGYRPRLVGGPCQAAGPAHDSPGYCRSDPRQCGRFAGHCTGHFASGTHLLLGHMPPRSVPGPGAMDSPHSGQMVQAFAQALQIQQRTPLGTLPCRGPADRLPHRRPPVGGCAARALQCIRTHRQQHCRECARRLAYNRPGHPARRHRVRRTVGPCLL